MKALSIMATLASLTTALPASAQVGTGTCAAPPEPVVSLDFGSRYTDESASF